MEFLRITGLDKALKVLGVITAVTGAIKAIVDLPENLHKAAGFFPAIKIIATYIGVQSPHLAILWFYFYFLSFVVSTIVELATLGLWKIEEEDWWKTTRTILVSLGALIALVTNRFSIWTGAILDLFKQVRDIFHRGHGQNRASFRSSRYTSRLQNSEH